MVAMTKHRGDRGMESYASVSQNGVTWHGVARKRTLGSCVDASTAPEAHDSG